MSKYCSRCGEGDGTESYECIKCGAEYCQDCASKREVTSGHCRDCDPPHTSMELTPADEPEKGKR